ncbi:MAG TPA: hypothetical protein VHS28_01310 [Chloroflexota bacterium]|nr:hypothetical protein [Chloroflexota bacterium]
MCPAVGVIVVTMVVVSTVWKAGHKTPPYNNFTLSVFPWLSQWHVSNDRD